MGQAPEVNKPVGMMSQDSQDLKAQAEPVIACRALPKVLTEHLSEVDKGESHW